MGALRDDMTTRSAVWGSLWRDEQAVRAVTRARLGVPHLQGPRVGDRERLTGIDGRRAETGACVGGADAGGVGGLGVEHVSTGVGWGAASHAGSNRIGRGGFCAREAGRLSTSPSWRCPNRRSQQIATTSTPKPANGRCASSSRKSASPAGTSRST